jgi:hypothetical protein
MVAMHKFAKLLIMLSWFSPALSIATAHWLYMGTNMFAQAVLQVVGTLFAQSATVGQQGASVCDIVIKILLQEFCCVLHCPLSVVSAAVVAAVRGLFGALRQSNPS